MKKLALIICLAFLVPTFGARAHQENHVHSQWVKQELNQLRQTIQQLRMRMKSRETGGGQSTNSALLQEACGPKQGKLCSKTCSVGAKIAKANCIGKGNIGKTYHSDRGVTCYCFNENDPNCRVEGITATCVGQ